MSESNNQNQIIEKTFTVKQLIDKISDVYKFLLSKWLIIVLSGILGGGVGLAYAFWKKPTYTATMTFALEDDKGSGGLGGALGLASQVGIDLMGSAGGAFSGVNLLELMKSRKLIEKTLLSSVRINGKDITLVERYIESTKMRKGWKNKPELDKISFPTNADRSSFVLQHDSILGKIYETLMLNQLSVAQRDKKISIYIIQLTSGDELFAKLFTERLAKEVSDFYIETKSKKSRNNVAILERQADSIRNELNSAITGVATATDNTYNLNPALNVKRVPSARRQVDVQANTAILTELVKNLELAKVSLRRETPLIQIIDSPILPLKKEKVGKIIGTLTGGFIGGFLCLTYLLGGLFWKKLYN